MKAAKYPIYPMAHIGILCPPSTGHLNTMTPLGYVLKQRGHQVTVFAIPDAKSKILAAGLEHWEMGASEFPVGWAAQSLLELGQLRGVAAVQRTVQIVTESAAMNLREAPAAMREARVDLLLVDQVTPEGGTIAEFLDIPFISICSALILNQEETIPPFFTTWPYSQSWWAIQRNRLTYKLAGIAAQPYQRLLNGYRQQWKLPLHDGDNQAYSRLAQLSQQPAELEFPRQKLPACFHFTGPYHNIESREPAPFPFERLNGKPLIYASLGTVQNRLLWVFRTIAAACADLDAQLVLSLGGATAPEALPDLPGTPLVVRYAPQLELLPRASLTLTHAGMNTTLECLSHGIPMVAIPITNDQPGVAARIQWAGAGRMVPLQQLSASKLRAAIQQVLQEPSYKQQALRLQRAIEQAGGAQRAAEIIETVLATGKPVLAAS